MFRMGLIDESMGEKDRDPETKVDTRTFEEPLMTSFMQLRAMCKNFKFCITTEGYMGRVPNGTKTGDVVAVFLGGKVPFVLRKYEGKERFYLVGECCKLISYPNFLGYRLANLWSRKDIHGIMEGEVIEELNKGKRSTEEFFIL